MNGTMTVMMNAQMISDALAKPANGGPAGAGMCDCPADCPDCQGQGCPNCCQPGQVGCDNCQGSGQMSEMSDGGQCDNCAGTGRVDCPNCTMHKPA
jgi:hypothetical protein